MNLGNMKITFNVLPEEIHCLRNYQVCFLFTLYFVEHCIHCSLHIVIELYVLLGRTSSFTKPVVTKKSVSKQSTTSLKIRKISVCLHDSQIKNSKKPTGRSLRISLSKVKNAGTKSLISTRASLKPTIRSTRSCTVQKDTSFQKYAIFQQHRFHLVHIG